MKIASDSGCYLFLDFTKSGLWHDGTAMFVHRDELIKWEQLLEKETNELKQSFGYIQEQEQSLAIAKLLQSSLVYLEKSLLASEDKKTFESNGVDFWRHYEEILKLHQNVLYSYEVNFRNQDMCAALSDLWWQK